MKIFVTIYQMQEGGAARVTSVMINGLIERGYDVVLCTDSCFYSVFYPLSSKVKILSYNLKPSKLNKYVLFSRAILRMRKYILQEQPDVVIGVESIFFFLVKIASLGLRIPVVAVDHTSMGRDMGRFINWIRHSFYQYSSALSILTKKDAKLLGDSVPQKKVIYNPLSFTTRESLVFRKKKILCVGRLNVWHIKGFDIMLDIWAKLYSKYPDWTLEIAGTGSTVSIQEINEMIEKKNLSGSVKLLGQIEDMQKLYQQTSIFALPSRVEGFPMCLIEAMSQGCACVAFSVQGAVDEIIEKNISGLVVDDGDYMAFSNALEYYLNLTEYQRDNLAKQIMERSKMFSKESFINNWVKLLNDVISK